jgi:hypothetical protein
MKTAHIKPFALCIDNTDYQPSLIPGKVDPILPDPAAAQDDFVRIVDESGEDYLYHKSHFVFVEFPPAVKKKILALKGAAWTVGTNGQESKQTRRPFGSILCWPERASRHVFVIPRRATYGYQRCHARP